MPRGGRLFVVSHPRHRDSGFCTTNGLASMALCHLPARQRCDLADVVVCVTPPIADGSRLLLGCFAVTHIVDDVPTYLRLHPARKDAIYTVAVKRQCSRKKTALRAISKARALRRGGCGWRADYSDGSSAVFRLKKNAKYHRLTPQPRSRTKAWLGAKTLTERKRDFSSRVLLSEHFWRSSTAGLFRHSNAVPRRFCLRWQRRLRAGIFVEDKDFRRWLCRAIRAIRDKKTRLRCS